MSTPQQLENEIVASAGEVDQALAAAVAAVERLGQLLGERKHVRGPDAGPSGVVWDPGNTLDGAFALAAMRLRPHPSGLPAPVSALDRARHILRQLREAP